jgi:type I restriction enzyme S subunit
MDRSKWEYKKLGDCFAYIKNGANIKQVNGAIGIPITRIETLSNDVFNRDRMGYANIDDVFPYSSNILNDGDILMSHINSMKFLGRAVEYKKIDEEVIIHGMNLLRMIPTSNFLSSYAVSLMSR